jgi:hypothetical protein
MSWRVPARVQRTLFFTRALVVGGVSRTGANTNTLAPSLEHKENKQRRGSGVVAHVNRPWAVGRFSVGGKLLNIETGRALLVPLPCGGRFVACLLSRFAGCKSRCRWSCAVAAAAAGCFAPEGRDGLTLGLPLSPSGTLFCVLVR